MPWQVGIDEAGYGPNLGPFVMTLVACWVPEAMQEKCLWKALSKCVRRFDDEEDDRLLVADSKQVYSPAVGLHDLEKAVLSAHLGGFFERADTLETILNNLAPDEVPMLRQECWFVGDTCLPTHVPPDDLAAGTRRWRAASEKCGIRWGFCQSFIVAAPRFNEMVEKWDSKAAVLGVGLCQLMQRCLTKTSPEAMRVVIDKHGGRNQYSALLQNAFGDAMVMAQEEGRERSVYNVIGLDRQLRITIAPKADVEHFTVSLASMISKYMRELLMREFNRFWLTHVPGLKPTAGYPLDADRYYAAIRPTMDRLGIAERLVWRQR